MVRGQEGGRRTHPRLFSAAQIWGIGVNVSWGATGQGALPSAALCRPRSRCASASLRMPHHGASARSCARCPARPCRPEGWGGVGRGSVILQGCAMFRLTLHAAAVLPGNKTSHTLPLQHRVLLATHCSLHCERAPSPPLATHLHQEEHQLAWKVAGDAVDVHLTAPCVRARGAAL